MPTAPTMRDVSGLLSYIMGVLPRREGALQDQAALARAYWAVIERRDWLTVEVMSEAADLAVASAKWLPTPAEFLDWCVEADRRIRKREEAEAVPAAAVLSEGRLVAILSGEAPADELVGLKRAIASGVWDRGTAQGRLLARLRRAPTSDEIDAELRRLATAPDRHMYSKRAARYRVVPNLRGTLDAALGASLVWCAEGYR